MGIGVSVVSTYVFCHEQKYYASRNRQSRLVVAAAIADNANHDRSTPPPRSARKMTADTPETLAGGRLTIDRDALAANWRDLAARAEGAA
ncbi:MAG: hypothetical protein RLT05_01265, partial [Bauldia litoralis]